MVFVVSLVGRSPGTTHTVLCRLLEEGIVVDRLLVVSTSEEYAREAIRIVSLCPCPPSDRVPRALISRVDTLILPFRDIGSLEDLEYLRRKLSRYLGPGIVLDITGGRKLMAVAASLEALSRGATIVAAIVPDETYRRIKEAREECGKTAPERAKLLTIY